jgi:hypothetical protein
MPIRLRAPLSIAIGLASLLLLPAGAAKAAGPPAGFLGVVPQEVPSAADAARMAGVVETERLVFSWAQLEPQPGQWDFTTVDAEVGEAASRGIHVLPVLYGSPAWVSTDPAEPPRGRAEEAAWGRFVRTVVGRYGPGGGFWAGDSPRLPIRRWQVWNEPNYVLFWRPHPDARAYVRLLKRTAAAIRSVDTGATVLAAGLAPLEAEPPPWDFLREMYEVPGAKRSFDVAALHPYASSAPGVEYEVLQTRRVMAAAGDARTPLQITEIGVASDGGRRGERRQARFLTAAVGELLANRRRWRIAGVDWFTWRDGTEDVAHCPFCRRAGLIRRDRSPKPAWRALKRLTGSLSRSGQGRGRGR